MSNDKNVIIAKIKAAYPYMSDFDKGYLLGLAERTPKTSDECPSNSKNG